MNQKHQCMDGLKLKKIQTKLTLNSAVLKILCFSTAYDNTFVFSKVINPGADEAIVHVDKLGQVLFQKVYPDIINFFGMLNEDQVIVMFVPDQKIDFINLRSKTTRSMLFNYLFDDVAQMSIETFYDTKMFCIVEKGTYNDPRLRLNYFKESDYTSGNEKPVSDYQSTQNIWTYECPVRRVNQSSKIGWFTYKHESFISFFIYGMNAEFKWELQHIKVQNTIGVPYNLLNSSLSLANLWQIDEDSFMLVANSNKNVQHSNNEGIINNNYVLNVKEGTVRETSFYFKDKKDGFAWNELLIEYFNLGDICVFHTFKHEAGKTIKSPVYYVENKSENIIAEERWFATCYVNFYLPGFAKNTVIEGFYENGDVKDINVTTITVQDKMIDAKIISMFFMLHLNEDFDDDLLSDAIELLHGS